MPSTLPSKCPVARNESSPGTVMENFSSLPSGVPIVNSENGASDASVS